MNMQNIQQVLNETGRTISRGDRGLASMMDNEPRTEDRSPEGLIFSIDSDIKNMMEDYEVAVRNGENQRAQMIADAIDRMQKKKIKLQGGMADMAMRKQMAGGGDVVGISPEDKQMIQRAFSTQSNVGQTAQMLKNILVKKYPNIPENQINAILSKGVEDYSARPPMPENFAEGGEAQMQMSEQEAMAELEAAKPDFEIIEKLVMAVVQMISQGMDEAEVREYLREQGLDNEDMEELFQMVAERLQEESQAPAEEPIGKQLQGIM